MWRVSQAMHTGGYSTPMLAAESVYSGCKHIYASHRAKQIIAMVQSDVMIIINMDVLWAGVTNYNEHFHALALCECVCL